MTKKANRKAHRSGTRGCPLCDRICPLVEHHIHGREVKNANHPSNLAWVCASCHDRIHTDVDDRIIIEGWFMTSKGRELIWRHKHESPKINEGAKPPLYGE
jgi:uncharacterized protein YlaI